MSWQAYIDTQLTATGQVAEACMLGKADASLWAGTPDFMPRGYNTACSNEDGSQSEQPINEAAGMVTMASTLKPARPGGMRINGQKYMPVRTMPTGVMDDNLPTVYFKKPKGGGCFVVTNQCIIIATFDETKGQNASACNQATENLGRYLMQSGY